MPTTNSESLVRPNLWLLTATLGGSGTVFTNQTNGYYVLLGFNVTASAINLLRPDGNTCSGTLVNTTGLKLIIPPGFGIFAQAALTIRAYGYWVPDMDSLRGLI